VAIDYREQDFVEEVRSHTDGHGADVILVRPETSPEDVHGLAASTGVLTSHGGLVSHAAIVARSMGKPAVCGADEVEVDVDARRLTVGDTTVEEGETISLSGTTGEVVLGEVPVVRGEPDEVFHRLLGWADELRHLDVRANADTAEDAERARELGASGIGLCRTEHQFLGDRLPLVQRALVADDADDEREALAELEEVQREDFGSLLEAMDGLPVTVRLLDPPADEFLPDRLELELAEARGDLANEDRQLLDAVRELDEVNPMMGVRGVRLAVLRPELYRMQARALAAAARALAAGEHMVERAGGFTDVLVVRQLAQFKQRVHVLLERLPGSEVVLIVGEIVVPVRQVRTRLGDGSQIAGRILGILPDIEGNGATHADGSQVAQVLD
jgi:pyruvate,orthophosphate dikinase